MKDSPIYSRGPVNFRPRPRLGRWAQFEKPCSSPTSAKSIKQKIWLHVFLIASCLLSYLIVGLLKKWLSEQSLLLRWLHAELYLLVILYKPITSLLALFAESDGSMDGQKGLTLNGLFKSGPSISCSGVSCSSVSCSSVTSMLSHSSSKLLSGTNGLRNRIHNPSSTGNNCNGDFMLTETDTNESKPLIADSPNTTAIPTRTNSKNSITNNSTSNETSSPNSHYQPLSKNEQGMAIAMDRMLQVIAALDIKLTALEDRHRRLHKELHALQQRVAHERQSLWFLVMTLTRKFIPFL